MPPLHKTQSPSHSTTQQQDTKLQDARELHKAATMASDTKVR